MARHIHCLQTHGYAPACAIWYAHAWRNADSCSRIVQQRFACARCRSDPKHMHPRYTPTFTPLASAIASQMQPEDTTPVPRSCASASNSKQLDLSTRRAPPLLQLKGASWNNDLMRLQRRLERLWRRQHRKSGADLCLNQRASCPHCLVFLGQLWMAAPPPHACCR